jgi:hypothetical protein
MKGTVIKNKIVRLGLIALAIIIPLIPPIAAYIHFAPEFRPSARFDSLIFPSGQSQVSLEIDTFEVSARRLTGTTQVHLRSDAFTQNTWETIKNTGKIHLFLMHSTQPDHYLAVGGSTAQVELAEMPDLELTGDEGFWWNVDTIISEFWYPFDCYKMVVNPRLAVRDDTMKFYRIGQLEINMSVPGLYMNVTKLINNDSSADQYEVYMQRPWFIYFTTSLVAIMVGFLVLYFMFFAKIDQLVWQPIASLAALWGIRGILRADYPSSSPIFIDYVTIITYGIIAITILVRWWLYKRQARIDNRDCPFCYSEIKRKAKRCPYCTMEITPEEPASPQDA